MLNKEPKDAAKIVLTGGHAATTGIAVIEEIASEKLPWKLFWIGAKYAVEGKKITTLEYRVLPSYGVVFLPLTMGRLQRRFTFWTIPSILKIPVGFVQAIYLLIRTRPQAVLSFGGFSSFPVVVGAKLLRIPVIIHEQTAAAGRANLAAVPFADKIAISRMDSKKYFPANKIELTGNPVSAKMFSLKPKMYTSKTPVIFVTGGSRGSKTINSALEEILGKLLTRYKVIHQTGELDIVKFKDIKVALPDDLAKNYEVEASVDPSRIMEFYEKADLVVGRCGANTASEILAIKRPAIVIPLPISYLDEQTKNAKILESFGAARIIAQDSLTGDRLLSEIVDMFAKYPLLINKINKIESPDKLAASKLVGIVKEYVK